MAADAHPRPRIENSDFVHLFEMKRYFVVDLAGLIAIGRITKPDLSVAAEKIDKTASPSRVRSLLRNEPVSFEHAQVFVKAINGLLDERGHSREKLDPAEAVAGAFFVIDGLAAAMNARKIAGPALAQASRYPDTVVSAAEQGYRLTLGTALDIVRALNSLSNQENEPLDPAAVILTDYRKGRKAAAKGCLAHRDDYVKWPPDTLSERDMPASGGRSNVTRLRAGR